MYKELAAREKSSGRLLEPDLAPKLGQPGARRTRTRPPTPLPQQGCPPWLQARYPLALGCSPGQRGSGCLSPGSPLQRPDATSSVAPRAKAPAGTVRPLRSRSGSSPRGTENNGRERPAPPPLQILYISSRYTVLCVSFTFLLSIFLIYRPLPNPAFILF